MHSSTRVRKSTKPVPAHPKPVQWETVWTSHPRAVPRKIVPRTMSCSVRQPIQRRPGPGRPRKNPLSMEELEEKMEGIRVEQGKNSLEVYIEQFKESLEDLWDPFYEKDLITLFVEGLRTDVRCAMGRRDDRDTVDCLETVYLNAKEEDYEIQKWVPYWDQVTKDLQLAQDLHDEPIVSDWSESDWSESDWSESD